MITVYSVLLPLALGVVGFVLLQTAGFGRGVARTVRGATAVIANILLGLALIIGALASDDVQPEGLALWMVLAWALGVAVASIAASLRPANTAPDSGKGS